ncbi:hypothetical protein ABL78_2011 [Leptomonas seymouri]|uniref:Uncharacterized protein n=1 Tax=Leptomonas seymouri TaxID=5684 RepID=A0A0N1HZX2_LEPSE|nr:hypothetical protein ABL78_2011 [Leptomonas seymouri]|eukprot:KPI88894.1 hypothetical protein ABL78_2011 [Leptomonas seymouri]
MFSTAFLSASKKHLRLKCSGCLRLLPSEHFPHKNGPLSTLVCTNCKEMCFGCGLRQPRSGFSDPDSGICDRCMAKRQVARENVYFRFPVLKYRSCPFSVDEAREELRREEHSKPPPPSASHGSTESWKCDLGEPRY